METKLIQKPGESLVEILKGVLPYKELLSDWERGFLGTVVDSFITHGEKAVFTEKQWKSILKIKSKLKV